MDNMKLLKQIGNYVGKAFNKKEFSIISYSIPNVYTLCFETAPEKYLHIFLCANKIYALNKAISEYALFELPESLKTAVFDARFSLFKVKGMYFSMKEVVFAELQKYCFDENFLIIDESVTNQYKKVSSFISNYREFIDFKNSDNFHTLEVAEKNYFSNLDAKALIAEKIAKACSFALKLNVLDIVFNEFEKEYKIQIVLGKDNLVKRLFCILDKKELLAYYLTCVNGQWQKYLLPDDIFNVTKCFL